jgi:hypothetical protein
LSRSGFAPRPARRVSRLPRPSRRLHHSSPLVAPRRRLAGNAGSTRSRGVRTWAARCCSAFLRRTAGTAVLAWKQSEAHPHQLDTDEIALSFRDLSARGVMIGERLKLVHPKCRWRGGEHSGAKPGDGCGRKIFGLRCGAGGLVGLSV